MASSAGKTKYLSSMASCTGKTKYQPSAAIFCKMSVNSNDIVWSVKMFWIFGENISNFVANNGSGDGQSPFGNNRKPSAGMVMTDIWRVYGTDIWRVYGTDIWRVYGTDIWRVYGTDIWRVYDKTLHILALYGSINNFAMSYDITDLRQSSLV